MDELNKQDTESVDQYIKRMLEDFSESEIKTRLINNYNFTHYEADDAFNRVLKIKLNQAIRRGLLFVTVLLSISLILVLLFLYFKHLESENARYMIERGNGINLGNETVIVKGPFGYYEIFGKFAGYSLTAAVIISLKVFFGWIKYRKIK